MGGFTAMQMEREEFHVLLLISFLHLTENQFKNLPLSPDRWDLPHVEGEAALATVKEEEAREVL